ncbi:unnamed protein product [Cyprideis torosa]|uniref:DNA-directed DNA polymerase n=1 Tax=Cyprideis torosa TaxID=163714 RepID=A0A7R8W7B0_9CRUS|nr:unnamed protein product [Cyprideis torosa]CAG0882014.1 unnamed protein product [Cyprideis torosa]
MVYESDIKPCDRYLMERFITGACSIAGKPIQHDGYIQYTNPRLTAAPYRPKLRTLSLDIETNYHTDAVLSIAGLCYGAGLEESAVVFIVSNDYIPPGESLTYRNYPHEKNLLMAFMSWVNEIDPDILCGWNVVNFDLMHLQKRCSVYGLALNLSRAGKPASIIPGKQNSHNAFARISGRVVLDGIDCLRLTSSITKRGHEIILKTRELIEAKGYKVIYGDTDSVFVWLEGEFTSQQARQTGKTLQESLNHWWTDHIQTHYRLPCYLELEFETHFERFFMPTMRGSNQGSKKRYAGVISNSAGEKKIIFKGLETVRTDWTPLAREFQRELFERIFNGQPFEAFIRELVQKMYNGDFDAKLRYRKRIRQDIDSYIKNVPPHIQAARQLPEVGQWIEYHITQGGPQPSNQIDNAIDYAHYQEKQLKPVADTILQFVGHSFDDIISGQMEFFQ